MKTDFHTHTNFSSDADPAITPKLQIEAAIRKGLKMICITDHYDEDYPAKENGLDEAAHSFRFDLERYFHTLSELRESYREEIDVRIGVEIGLQPHLGAFYHEMTGKYPFDFVIGSAHVFGGIDPYFERENSMKSDEERYREAFEEMLVDVQNIDDFDVLGHIDYIVRYGKEQAKHYHYSMYKDVLDEILKTVIMKGKGIELNTAGFKYGLGFAHPKPEILKRYRELGGEIITVGSDGHRPEHLAYDFNKVKEILNTAGFRYYTVFRERKPVFLSI